MQLPLENLSIYAEKGYEVTITGETDGIKIDVRCEKNGEKFRITKRMTNRMMETDGISAVKFIEEMIGELNYGADNYETIESFWRYKNGNK